MTARHPSPTADAVAADQRLMREIKAENDEALPAVSRRGIRSTGREFEEGFRCDADPSAAERAARAYAKGIDYMRSPSVRQVSATEFSVHWWAL